MRRLRPRHDMRRLRRRQTFGWIPSSDSGIQPLYLRFLVVFPCGRGMNFGHRAARGGHAPHERNADVIVPALEPRRARSFVAGSVG